MKKEWYIVTAKCIDQNDMFVKNIRGLNPYDVFDTFMRDVLPIYAAPLSYYSIKIELDQSHEPNRHEVLEESIKWLGCGYGWQIVNTKESEVK